MRVYAIRISFIAGEKLTEAAHWSTGLHRPAYCKLHGPTVSIRNQVRVRMHSQCMIYKPEGIADHYWSCTLLVPGIPVSTNPIGFDDR